MTAQFADFTRQAAADRAISDEEVSKLRQSGWADGQILREEAEAIFALQHALDEPTETWSDFFVDALRTYVLNGSEPRGYASEEEAEWLIAMVQADGKVCSLTEFELLVQVIEQGKNVPEKLKTYVLETVEREVLTGTGPTRCGGELSDAHVTEAEASILRRVVFGAASDRPAAVSMREAELLFRLKDATLEAANHPEFKRIFVQGVGNYLMGFASHSAHVSRERMLELETFIADTKPDIGRFMGQMFKAAPNAFAIVFGKKDEGPSREEQVAEEAEITPYEQDWLDAQIAANGQIDEYDQALLEFIAEETGEA
ncbi:hypothetical protein [Alteraurantiacibacter aquimixticola]|uniref:Uncharacterized protein n=1 Tax=Alteraurantiacibacter aquimixticola TaxID=2489173 RepID=A0A4T3EYF1_9SPHN|nr:hypothetical protein [Alteraurantiacibacter aquimixticola]TIX49101.1 hypothetical protein E5222_15370 [Alteraurantiacibacter aquimixticola]